ncbi:polyprenyl synthetase family protein [Nitratiruptor tergarcus]|nr:polyprenyl synthetase family protein [Nitratiruptor tergarcus]
MDLAEVFEKHLQKNLIDIQTYHPYYKEALNFMLQAGGKRFRPVLLLSVVKAANPLLIPSALDAALAIEILHTYSLIHDDLPVMDDADLRRGKPTLHKKFDELTAVLVGDALNTHAFYILVKAALHNDVKIKLVQILSFNGGVHGMVHGQILDCHFEGEKLTLEELKTLHRNKTAKLIAASLEMGAVIANLGEEIEKNLYDFGLQLGLLFQIQDDIIDEIMSEAEAGKTTKNDALKNSFVNLLGLEGAIKEADALAKKIEEDLGTVPANVQEELKKLLQQYLYRHKKESNG